MKAPHNPAAPSFFAAIPAGRHVAVLFDYIKKIKILSHLLRQNLRRWQRATIKAARI
jgi:hypothetical protein